MIKDFYYDKLNLNENFFNLISSFEIFKYALKAHFIFLSTDNSSIIYQYSFNANDIIYDSIYHEIHKKSCVFFDNGSVNYRIWDNEILKDSKLYKENHFWLAASICSPLSCNENDSCCVVLFCIQDERIIKNIRKYIDEDYLIQTALHVHMVIKNYEKIPYSIDSFVEMMAKKDVHMPYHMTNVSNLCMNVASKLNLDRHTTNILYISALIHDVGKLYIPDQIINKNKKLDENEYKTIKMHSIKGEEIAKATFWGMNLLKDIPKIIRSHHENYDGSGYPDALKGKEINYLSRIIRVADSVDAMMHRFYNKESLNISEVINILKQETGRQFDPEIVEIMIEILKEDNILNVPKLGKEAHFFPKAMLSFFYKNLEDMISISGNLVSDTNGVRFLIHNEDSSLSKFESEYMYKTTFSFFNQNNLYQYSADVLNLVNNNLLLENVTNIPSDKYFSLSWNSCIYMKKHMNEFFKAEIINLGVESIIIKSDIENSDFMVKNFSKTIRALLLESIDEINLEIMVDLKIEKYYSSSTHNVFICKYENLSSKQKDQILKILFRKQVNLRKGKR